MDKLSSKTERELAEFIGTFAYDPLGFVMAVFPWGQDTLADGTVNVRLQNKPDRKAAPEKWQIKFLKALGGFMVENAQRKALDLDYFVWRSAVASGHGVGKSALVAWLIIFFMSTRPDCRGIVTANTGDQLEGKTWPELGVWHDLAINKHWFGRTATTFFFAQYPEEKRKNYGFVAQTVSPERSEAFAGLHNAGSAVVMIMDEASGIDAKVTEVAEGAMTDGEPFLIKFGNPTRPDGDFYDCFTKPEKAELYYRDMVDNREVSLVNQMAIANLLKQYGEDSDEAKVRVYGQFPVQAFDGFLSPSIVTDAMTRELWEDASAPLILGVDVARYGNDRTIIYPRKGRDARTYPVWAFKGLSTTDVARKVADYAMVYKPDAIVIESTGPGAGVVDQLRAWGYQVHEVHPGAQSAKAHAFGRLRDEWWGTAREWIYAGGCLRDDKDLFGELTKIQYRVDGGGETKLSIESKKLMKERLGFSPDLADGFVLTFAVKQIIKRGAPDRPFGARQQASLDYDMYAL